MIFADYYKTLYEGQNNEDIQPFGSNTTGDYSPDYTPATVQPVVTQPTTTAPTAPVLQKSIQSPEVTKLPDTGSDDEESGFISFVKNNPPIILGCAAAAAFLLRK